jgi:TolB-like protein
MKKIILTFCVLSILSFCFSGPLTVGVMPFANNSLSGKADVEPLCRGLADMMSTELSKIGALKIIERAQMDRIIREMGLAQAGLVDEASAAKAGKLLGADLLMLGSFNQGFDGEIRIDARLVKVETGEAIKAEEVTGKVKKLFKLVEKLSFKIADKINVKLSGAEKDALETRDNEDINALLAFSKGLDAEDKGDTAQARACYEKALSINPKYSRAKKQLESLKGVLP